MGNLENLVFAQSGATDWLLNNSGGIAVAGTQGLIWLLATSVFLLALTWLFQRALRVNPSRCRSHPMSPARRRGTTKSNL